MASTKTPTRDTEYVKGIFGRVRTKVHRGVCSVNTLLNLTGVFDTVAIPHRIYYKVDTGTPHFKKFDTPTKKNPGTGIPYRTEQKCMPRLLMADKDHSMPSPYTVDQGCSWEKK